MNFPDPLEAKHLGKESVTVPIFKPGEGIVYDTTAGQEETVGAVQGDDVADFTTYLDETAAAQPDQIDWNTEKPKRYNVTSPPTEGSVVLILQRVHDQDK